MQAKLEAHQFSFPRQKTDVVLVVNNRVLLLKVRKDVVSSGVKINFLLGSTNVIIRHHVVTGFFFREKNDDTQQRWVSNETFLVEVY